MIRKTFCLQRLLMVVGFVFSFTFLTVASAKDMTSRLGAGFKNNTSQNLPSIAVVYYATKDIALTGGMGINTTREHSAYQLHAGLRKMIFMEPNLNFYTGAQVGVVTYENPIDGKANDVEVMGVFGAEFYLTGLDNLAFTFEAGAAMSSAYNTRFRTVGDDPLRAGILFYF